MGDMTTINFSGTVYVEIIHAGGEFLVGITPEQVPGLLNWYMDRKNKESFQLYSPDDNMLIVLDKFQVILLIYSAEDDTSGKPKGHLKRLK